MLQNTQQFYDEEKKFKLVGDLALEAGPKFIDVNPEAIAGFWDFVPVDGTLPIDRFAQANLWRELLAGMARFPQVLERYDIGRIFGWVAQLAGLKNINQFRIDIVPDEQLARAAEAGDVVPMPSGGDPSILPRGQVGQVGPTG